jgi:transposase
VYLVKPQKVSDYWKFRQRHTKSDVADATAVGLIPEADPDGVHEAPVMAAERFTIRRLLMRRNREIENVAARKKRIQALVRMALPGVLEALGPGWDARAPVAFLRKRFDPFGVVKSGPESLRKLWRRHSRSEGTDEHVDRVYSACTTVVALLSPLREAGRLPFDYAALQDEVNDELTSMENSQALADKLEQEATARHRRLNPDRTLEQLRGVGPLIAAAIESIVGSVTRFRNARRFVAYAGSCPRKHQTGVTDPNQPMTKAGNRLLKKYLYLAADVARHYDPDFAAYYAKRYEKGHHHNAILGALTRKMALRVYALLRRRDVGQAPESCTPVTYELRDETGKTVTRAEARDIVKRRYARQVVSPARAAADAKRGAPTAAPKAPPQALRAEATAVTASASPATGARPEANPHRDVSEAGTAAPQKAHASKDAAKVATAAPPNATLSERTAASNGPIRRPPLRETPTMPTSLRKSFIAWGQRCGIPVDNLFQDVEKK